MASYVLKGSTSTVQVLSPTSSQEAVVATIETIPSGVIAYKAVSRVSFDTDMAAEQLTGFAEAIEAVMSQGKAVSGVGTSDLDSSGLTQYFVTFTVGYNPPGAPPGQVTVDVDVPVGLLDLEDAQIGQTLLSEAEDLIDKAYQNLVSLSKG